MITEDHASWVTLGADHFKFVQCKHMQLSEKEKQDIRARLASRKSFFGSSLSTAGASVSNTYVSAQDLRETEKVLAEAKRQAQVKKQAAKEPPRESVIKPVLKKAVVDYSAFDLLTEDKPQQTSQPSRVEAPGPRVQHQPKHQAHAPGTAKPQSLPSQGQTPRSRSVTPPPQQAGPSRSTAARSRSATPPRLSQQATWQTQGDFRAKPTNGTGGMSLSRHSPPRRSQQLASQANIRKSPSAKPAHRGSKKGEASRRTAVAPQAGATRSQKAAEAWATQLDKLRQENGKPPLHTSEVIEGRSTQQANRLAENSKSLNGRPPLNRSAGQALRGAPGLQNNTSKNPSRISQDRSREATQLASRQDIRTTGSATAASAAGRQCGNAGSSRPESLNLQGRDLSRLPAWQREILEKKMRAQAMQRKRGREESETESELDDFVVDDRDTDWRNELKTITGYDPSRFKDEKDNRSMEADWRSIQAEERRSARLGRSEDERAEHEELARQKAKAAKKKAKRPNNGFLLG